MSRENVELRERVAQLEGEVRALRGLVDRKRMEVQAYRAVLSQVESMRAPGGAVDEVARGVAGDRKVVAERRRSQ
jgi:uncharacterized protein YlxW (UPF0749 family)